MKNKLSTLSLTGLLAANLLFPVTTLAQVNQDTPTIQNQSGDTGTTGTTNTTGTPTNTEDEGFNPMWLLPLLLVPLAFMLWPKEKRDHRDENRGYAGAKGGETSHYEKNSMNKNSEDSDKS
jgi:hypothetical protein